MTPKPCLLAAAVLFTAGCGEPPTAPPDGASDGRTLTASVTIPGGETDGAVAVTMTNPRAVTAVASVDTAARLYWRQVSDSEVRVIVVGTIHSGPLFTIEAGTGGADGFTGTVTQAARLDNALRSSLEGYALTIAGGGG